MLTPQDIHFFYKEDSELSNTLPCYPLLPPEIQVFPLGEKGIIFSGPIGIKVFNGESAAKVIPVLIPYLDGRKAVNEISSTVKCIDSVDIERIICFLHFHGLLEHGDPKVLNNCPSYIGAYSLVHQRNVSRSTILKEVNGQRVLIIGPELLTDYLRSELNALDVNQVKVINKNSITESVIKECSCIVYLSVVVDGDREFLSSIDINLDFKNVFFCEISSSGFQIGPVISSISNDVFNQVSQLYKLPANAKKNISNELALSVITLNFYNFISKLTTRNMFNSCLLAYDLGEGIETINCFVSILDDAKANSDRIANNDIRDNLLRYHACLDVPPPAYVSPKSYRVHYDQKNIFATRLVLPEFYGSAKIFLNRPEAVVAPSEEMLRDKVSSQICLSKLAAILYYSVGYVNTADEGVQLKRIAPSGGNLQSCQFYIFAYGVEELDNGVYRYNGAEHCLEHLATVKTNFIHGLVDKNYGSGIYVFSVSDHGKVERKYGPRAFRIVHFDAGVSAYYAWLIAMANGLDFVALSETLNKTVATALGIPTINDKSIVTGIYKISSSSNSMRNQQQIESQLVYGALFSEKSEYYQKTYFPVDSVDIDSNRGNLNRILLGRISQRYFSLKAVSKDVLINILSAINHCYKHSSCSGTREFDIDVIVIVKSQTDGMSNGIYSFSNSLNQISSKALSNDQANQFISQYFPSEAPVIIVFTLNPTDFSSYENYRRAHVLTGSMLAALWIAAEIQGVKGVPMGAVSSMGFWQQIPKGKHNHYPLLAFCMGYPKENTFNEL